MVAGPAESDGRVGVGHGFLAAQRRAAMAAMLRQVGAVRVTDVMATFAISAATARRDLEHLARSGFVHRVHGGAILAGIFDAGAAATDSEQYGGRSGRPGEMASPGPGSGHHLTVGLVGSDDVAAVGRSLAALGSLRFVTNSRLISDALCRHCTRPEVILLGGEYTPTGTTVGGIASSGARLFRLDCLFVEPYGVDASFGLSLRTAEEAAPVRELVRNARRVVARVMPETTGRTGRGWISPLDAVDQLECIVPFPDGGWATWANLRRAWADARGAAARGAAPSWRHAPGGRVEEFRL